MALVSLTNVISVNFRDELNPATQSRANERTIDWRGMSTHLIFALISGERNETFCHINRLHINIIISIIIAYLTTQLERVGQKKGQVQFINAAGKFVSTSRWWMKFCVRTIGLSFFGLRLPHHVWYACALSCISISSPKFTLWHKYGRKFHVRCTWTLEARENDQKIYSLNAIQVGLSTASRRLREREGEKIIAIELVCIGTMEPNVATPMLFTWKFISQIRTRFTDLH